MGQLSLSSWLLASATLGSDVQLRIATRDDVDDAEYLQLGAPYGAVGRVAAGNRKCSGTMVRTVDGTLKVITSAHCVDWDFDNTPNVSPASVTFQVGAEPGGPTVTAQDIQVQTWNGNGGLDLALITFADFAPGESPIPLTASAQNPENEEFTVVGFGTHGTGLPPFENLSDDKRRAATNVADEVFESGVMAGEIRSDFDHPRDPAFSTMGEAFPTALEGTSGVGDSGGPLIMGNFVVGVLHGGINPTDAEFSEYGDVSIFAGLFHQPNVAFLRSNNVLVAGDGGATVSITVDSIAQPGQPFIALESGSPVRDGSSVQIGTFIPGFDPVEAELRDVARAWLPFGETEIRTIAAQPGRFSGTSSGDGSAFANSRIYWWITETSGGAPAPDLSNVSAWEVFSSSKVSWRFPQPGSPPPNNTTLISSADVDEAGSEGKIFQDRLVLTTIDGVLLDYETWALTAFSAQTPIAQRVRGANPDEDDFTNEMEWVLATSPEIAEFFSPLQLDDVSELITISYERQRFLPADSHRIDFSDDLVNWIPAVAQSTLVETIDQRKEKAVQEYVLQSERGFWRLTVLD